MRRLLLVGLCLFLSGVQEGKGEAQAPVSETGNLPSLPLLTPQLMIQTGHLGEVGAVAFTFDERYVLTASMDTTARLWETATGQEVRTFAGHASPVLSMAVSPDGRYVLTGSLDTTARLWVIATGQAVRTFAGHAGGVSSLVFSPDGQFVLTGSYDTTARLWATATGQEVRRFTGHTEIVSSVAFSPDGRYVLTGSSDKTARLWATATGQEVRRFTGHTDLVSSVAFSPDGRYVLTGGTWNKTARLWETATGKLVRRFVGHRELMNWVAVSPDGRYVLTGSSDRTARLWATATGQEVRRFTGHTDGVFRVAFSPDGRYVLTGSSDKTARLWATATGQEVQTFAGHTSAVTSMAVSPDGRYVLTGSLDTTARLWATATGQAVRTFAGHTDWVFSVAFAPDGQQVLTGSGDGTARLWETVTGQEVRRFTGHAGGMSSVAFSPDGRYVLTGSRDGTASLWETTTGQEVRRFTGHTDAVLRVAVSSDGRYVLTGGGGNDGTVRLWATETGQEVRRFGGHTHQFVSCVGFSPDGRFVVTGRNLDGTVRLWATATGQAVQTFAGHADGVSSVVFSPDGQFVLTGSYDTTARLWATATGQEVRRFTGHTDGVSSVAFSPDGRFVLTGANQTVRLWEAATGTERAQLIAFTDGTWAVVDPLGRFDASNGGKVEGLHWVVGMETIALNQLKERYYEPGLLAKVLGFNPEPLRDVSAFTGVALYPDIHLQDPTPKHPILGIELANRGGGIGTVQVSLNGKEVTADARGREVVPTAEAVTVSVDLAKHPYLIPGEDNVIEVRAYNAEGYLASRGVRTVFRPPGQTPTEPPILWGIVAGISDYAGDAIDLNLAAKDAVDIGHALELGAKHLFGADRVHLSLLTTAEETGGQRPTKANFLKAFQTTAQSAKSTDILVVYLAGHGVIYGGQEGDFYYLTSEARSADLTDPAIRDQAAISSAQLTDLIQTVPALKQVLILDTCGAGRVVEQWTKKRAVSASQIRALDRLKDRMGMFVLAGSAADAVSYEASRYGQGLLTYSLLLGMQGAALRDAQYVDVSTLFNHAVDQVPVLAQDIGGIQRPLVATPLGGASFDIGFLSNQEKTQFQIGTPRPMLVRAHFQDADRIRDHLGLAALVNEQLREISARGHDAPLLFLEAPPFPGAHTLAGLYTVAGSSISVTVLLSNRDQDVGRFTVEGTTAQIEELAQHIVEQAAGHLKNSAM